MKTYIKVFFVNLFIIIIGVVLVDVIFGNWILYAKNTFFEKDPNTRFTESYYKSVFRMCPDKYLHHKYCPEISHKTEMKYPDSGEVVVNYINKSSNRVSGVEEMGAFTDLSSYDIVNIGDSFLQADEIPYEYTLSRFLEAGTGKKALQVGMGSWAPINFYAWLKHNPLPHRVEVNMFVMTNDVLPNYANTNRNYYKLGNLNSSGELEFDDFSFIWGIFGKSDFAGKLKHALVMNSAIYRLLLRFKTKFNENKQNKDVPSPRVFSGKLTKPIADCTSIKNYDDISTRTRDYVLLAFELKCWDEDLLDSVDSAIRDLRKSIREVNKVEGKIRIFIIPAGFAFEDENHAGKTHQKYRMKEDAVITSEPLVEYISMQLKDMSIEVISLEKVIKNLKLTNENKFYFIRDGHWSKHAHKQLGKWMAKTFY
jgi:hypothetical protein